jgi:hypothetical protein
VRAATGRDPGDVRIAARCLLSRWQIPDPTPEQIAAAHLEAFHHLDIARIRAALVK